MLFQEGVSVKLRLPQRKSFGSVNDNKYLNAMWRSGKK
ncbi:DUF2737 family protein [Escherichia coli O26:H11]|nr:DUF2737 family protein [Escherichia coli O26:H11]QMT90604.1 DUF2737 family protein [Escherichia coli]